MVRFLVSIFLFCALANQALAQNSEGNFQTLLQENFKLVSRPSVRTISPLLDKISESDFEKKEEFLSKWQKKELWYRKADKQFFYVTTKDKKTYQLIDIETGTLVDEASKRDLKQIKPNSGVRALLDGVLVTFRLKSPDISVRRASLQSLKRKPAAIHLEPLRSALEDEENDTLKQEFKKLERLLTLKFGATREERIEAIKSLKGDLSLEVRAALNPLLKTSLRISEQVSRKGNIAHIIEPGKTVAFSDGTARNWSLFDWAANRKIELSPKQAYALLVKHEKAPALISKKVRNKILIENISNGKIANFDVASLNSEEMRDKAYQALSEQGLATPSPSEIDVEMALKSHVFYAVFDETDSGITEAAQETLASINNAVFRNRLLDLSLDALSLASIYFLAAIGLAITFGVMRVINMAHGEFIMMGAYSGYVVQQFVSNYTLSILLSIPLAFIVTFLAGVLMERLIIRHLYNRPLETLLATFGVSIALQQLAKNIFGTQARPLTAPDWLDGALVVNDVVSISWIRVAIFGLGILFFVGLWLTLNKTRLGLETRAVTQNPRMAAAMGINPDRINMLTFGLGSGIAGIAGVAIGLYAKVTSELGSDYIVQSFMTVVIGGVGNIWGTLAGAGLIGILQKLIENFNPSNTLAAQTYMIIFIIIFIQFKPRGLIALKGRAAEA